MKHVVLYFIMFALKFVFVALLRPCLDSAFVLSFISHVIYFDTSGLFVDYIFGLSTPGLC